MPEWLLWTIGSLTLIVLVVMLRRRIRDVRAKEEPPMLEEAAAAVAARVLIMARTEDVDHVVEAVIGADAEGAVPAWKSDADKDRVGPLQRQEILLIIVSPIAGEQIVFEGLVRIGLAQHCWTEAAHYAQLLIQNGDDALPWLAKGMSHELASEDVPPGILVSQKMRIMIEASMHEAGDRVLRDRHAFDRLRALLLEKKRLDREELARFLGVMLK